MADSDNEKPDRRQDDTKNNDNDDSGGLHPLGGFIIAVVVILLVAFFGWFLFRTIRARRLGLPPPSLNPFARRSAPANSSNTGYRAPAPAPSNPIDWLKDKFNTLRNKRTTTGGYESTGYGGNPRRQGFGALDPDEAWDARVGNEADYQGAYYEEQELGLQDPGHGPYGGGGYGEGTAGAHVGVGGIEEGRGRSRDRQRELDSRYDEMEMGAKAGAGSNPFGEGAERSDLNSLREASPRPLDTVGASVVRPKHQRGQSNLTTRTQDDDSPTERRSMFREDV